MNAHAILEFPLRGVWKSINSPGHDRFTFDLVALHPETMRRLNKSTWAHLTGFVSAQDFYSWAQPVYSPLDGKVAIATDGWPNREELNLAKDLLSMLFSRPELSPEDIRPFSGNFMIIENAGSYVFMAHLKQGSLAVSRGQQVARGQPVGEVGNSGFTLEPHLHLQLMDQIDNLVTAQAVPFLLRSYEQWDGEKWRLKENAVLEKGVRIRSVST